MTEGLSARGSRVDGDRPKRPDLGERDKIGVRMVGISATPSNCHLTHSRPRRLYVSRSRAVG